MSKLSDAVNFAINEASVVHDEIETLLAELAEWLGQDELDPAELRVST